MFCAGGVVPWDALIYITGEVCFMLLTWKFLYIIKNRVGEPRVKRNVFQTFNDMFLMLMSYMKERLLKKNVSMHFSDVSKILHAYHTRCIDFTSVFPCKLVRRLLPNA